MITADAVREWPGDSGPGEPLSAGRPVPAPVTSAALPVNGSAQIAETPPSMNRTFTLTVGGCLAGLALVFGTWLRTRRSHSLRPTSRSAGVTSGPHRATIAFQPAAAAAHSPLEALIRNELTLMEEPVQFPTRLEFHGWPAGSPLRRLDTAHAAATGTEAKPTLAGPHFLRRQPAIRVAVAGSAAPRPRARQAQLSQVSHRRSPGVAVHTPHVREPDPSERPAPAEEPSAAPGPLERALERLAREQT